MILLNTYLSGTDMPEVVFIENSLYRLNLRKNSADTCTCFYLMIDVMNKYQGTFLYYFVC